MSLGEAGRQQLCLASQLLTSSCRSEEPPPLVTQLEDDDADDDGDGGIVRRASVPWMPGVCPLDDDEDLSLWKIRHTTHSSVPASAKQQPCKLR